MFLWLINSLNYNVWSQLFCYVEALLGTYFILWFTRPPHAASFMKLLDWLLDIYSQPVSRKDIQACDHLTILIIKLY